MDQAQWLYNDSHMKPRRVGSGETSDVVRVRKFKESVPVRRSARPRRSPQARTPLGRALRVAAD